jgi:hypothetical protein
LRRTRWQASSPESKLYLAIVVNGHGFRPFLCDIRQKLLRLPVSLRWQWIEGHQDDHHSFHELSGLAQDNVSANTMAKERLNCLGLTGFVPVPQRFGDEGWSILLQGRKVSKLDYRHLYSTMWASTGLNYWAVKHDISFSAVLGIDWDLHGDALCSLSFSKRRRVVKHASCHFGVGTTLRKWGIQDNADCPRCQQIETPAHVLLCRDVNARTVWDTSP